jgi:hypothetical protein
VEIHADLVQRREDLQRIIGEVETVTAQCQERLTALSDQEGAR